MAPAAPLSFFWTECSRACEPTQPVRQSKMRQFAYNFAILMVHHSFHPLASSLDSSIMPQRCRDSLLRTQAQSRRLEVIGDLYRNALSINRVLPMNTDSDSRA